MLRDQPEEIPDGGIRPACRVQGEGFEGDDCDRVRELRASAGEDGCGFVEPTAASSPAVSQALVDHQAQ
ncbi:hypothetical protein E8P82_00730 [Arthrobacter echini]|uniref:Uncharacterized protein n=1 Tax=Arthrobacter echini TaxID=1529066 RepID=A0A4S5E9S9_9MICC|nr:hypothetical protein [Arthrobacter echini]THJ68476.1 hypothetical protein E8P82_00730 [Arthrobacter echini]